MVKPGAGHVLRQCFNLYWMTNQPYVTGQELTGNQCIQPPILHQYSVSLSHHKAAHLALSLSLFPLSTFCVSAVCFFESHSISILRTSLFLCFVFKWSGLHTGRSVQLWRRAGLLGEGGKEAARRLLESGFPLTRSLWGDDSWRNAPLIPLTRDHVTFGLAYFPQAGWVRGEQNVCQYRACHILNMRAMIWSHSQDVCVNTGVLPYCGSWRCGSLWPSPVGGLDCTSQRQWVQPVTHFCLSLDAKWASVFAVEWAVSDLQTHEGVPYFYSKNKTAFWSSFGKDIGRQRMFACSRHFVTKQRAGIDTHLDTLIPLDLVFTVQ